MKARMLALIGPTASGKSELALKVAPNLDAEIISLDSMMVYKGMDIGTAKPTPAERSRVRHHLIDILPPTEEYSVGRYVADVESALQEIGSSGSTVLSSPQGGKAALFVGGTALYWRALTRGLFLGPSARWEVRARLKEEALEKGTAALHERLKERDAEAAARIHPNDLRRIVRALEVIELSGAAMSELQKRSPRLIDPDSALVVAPDVPRKILYARIERRVDAMFRHGLVEEVKGLLEAHGRLGRSASQALGYKEVLAHLAGDMSLEEAEALVKKRTRHFARRQLTWLRSFPEVQWVQTSEPESEETASRMLEIFRAAN